MNSIKVLDNRKIIIRQIDMNCFITRCIIFFPGYLLLLVVFYKTASLIVVSSLLGASLILFIIESQGQHLIIDFDNNKIFKKWYLLGLSRIFNLSANPTVRKYSSDFKGSHNVDIFLVAGDAEYLIGRFCACGSEEKADLFINKINSLMEGMYR